MANSNGWGDGSANNAIGWGQGANNAIGWGKSHSTSWASATDIVGLSTDADAQAFISAAAITDATQQSAIDTLVKGMKADGTWTKMKAIYPFVGGTATAHKWNLKDPRDLDAAFRLVFNGGWTHSSTGATPNGTNGYADTKLSFSSVLTQGSYSYGVYSRTNIDENSRQIGVSNATIYWQLILRLGNNMYFDNPNAPSRILVANTDSRGYFTASRTTTSLQKGYKNGSSVGSETTSVSAIPLLNLNLYLSARNDLGTASAFATNQLAFSHISDGLTDTEAASLYTRVQAFQTSLSRQV